MEGTYLPHVVTGEREKGSDMTKDSPREAHLGLSQGGAAPPRPPKAYPCLQTFVFGGRGTTGRATPDRLLSMRLPPHARSLPGPWGL